MDSEAACQAFGSEVRELRLARGLTLQELGSRAGLSFRHLGEVERKGKDLRLSTVVKLVVALELSPDESAALCKRALDAGR